MIRPLIAALALALALSAGCAEKPKLTIESFRSVCWMNVSYNCYDVICDQFRDMLEAGKYTTAAECRADCNQMFLTLAAKYATSDCGASAGSAEDWCKKYCYQNFP